MTMRTKRKLLLSFAAGLVSGLMLAFCFTVWPIRIGSLGGEVLILPLIIFSICLGTQICITTREFREYQRGYDAGYEDGQKAGSIEICPIKIEILDVGYR